jgi:uncharacterized protein (TIGR03083 family)
MTTPSHLDHPAAIAVETARFAALVKGADLATPVPGCPGWTLADLVKHTGSVQRWFSVLLHNRIQEPPRSREVDLQLPADSDGYPDWLATSATVAAEAFAATDPALPMWAWGADQHARFWARRMLFETLMHRVDAELALGLEPEIEWELAVDGIDEFLVNLPYAAFFAPGVAGLRGQGETIGFRAIAGSSSSGGSSDHSDADANAWLVALRPDGFGLEPAADGTPTATVQGSPTDLLLFLYGRIPHTADRLTVGGNSDLLALWSANSSF